MYKAILMTLFISANLLLLVGISKTLDYLNTGADRSNILHLERAIKSSYEPETNWINTDNPGRELNPQLLENIRLDYLSAWQIKNQSLENNTTKGLKDYFTENPRKVIEQNIAFNKNNQISVKSTTLEHNIEIKLFSEDGQQVAFTDKNVISFEKYYKNNQLVQTLKDTVTYQVLMLLEDGFWRIRHLEKRPKEVKNNKPTEKRGIYTISGKNILKNGKNFTIKGINYYPQKSAWDTFGESFNLTVIDKDFALISDAGLNTIRVFVQYEDFGKNEVKPEKLTKLNTLLDTAQKYDLSCIVTLFDFYGDYSISQWTINHRHAEKIVKSCANHPAILAWDIKNEPNLDFESRGKQRVMDWLTETATVVRKNAPNHLITIGWSNPESAHLLSDSVDFISYHYYKDIDQFVATNKALNKAIDKPIVLQEFGVSSYRGIWNWLGYGEKGQAEFHKKMQDHFRKNNLAFISWTLYDFTTIPDAVVGKWPWQKSKQTSFGFVDKNGKKKAAFDAISY